MLMPVMYLAILRSSSPIWIDSSQVGANTSAWVCRSDSSMPSISGMPNAAVLPVPVCAWPITSRPSSNSGITRD